MNDLDAAIQRWRDANIAGQSTDLIFAALVRSLTDEQKRALAELLKLVELDEAFRWF